MGTSTLTKYTIFITKQNGVHSIYPSPPPDLEWHVYSGTTIQFVNTTDAKVRVQTVYEDGDKVSIDVYQGGTPFNVAANGTTVCVGDLSELSKENGQYRPFIHLFEVEGGFGQPPHVMGGGPRMVPTDPDF